jgi:hypothetical protein
VAGSLVHGECERSAGCFILDPGAEEGKGQSRAAAKRVDSPPAIRQSRPTVHGRDVEFEAKLGSPSA